MLGGQPTASWRGPERHPLPALDSPPNLRLPQRTARAQHAPLEQQLAADLLALSPKLQQVAQYCLQHARTLHLCRILDVAEYCDTQPVTVVRLAKRYGFRGFLDFKMAFLAQAHAEAPGLPDNATPLRDMRPRHRPDRLDAELTHHARAAMAQCLQGLSRLERDWRGASFSRAVALLQRAPTVWIHHSPTARPIARCYADLLCAAGCRVQWLEPSGSQCARPGTQAATTAHASGWSPHDVLLTLKLACDGEHGQEAACMVQGMGVPVVVLTDQPHTFQAQAADAHLCVTELGLGLRGLSAGMLLAQALGHTDRAANLCWAP